MSEIPHNLKMGLEFLRKQADPAALSIEISPEQARALLEALPPQVAVELPVAPGLYRIDAEADQLRELKEFHFDAREFYYLNTLGHWVDLGWGMPANDSVKFLIMEGPLRPRMKPNLVRIKNTIANVTHRASFSSERLLSPEQEQQIAEAIAKMIQED